METHLPPKVPHFPCGNQLAGSGALGAPRAKLKRKKCTKLEQTLNKWVLSGCVAAHAVSWKKPQHPQNSGVNMSASHGFNTAVPPPSGTPEKVTQITLESQVTQKSLNLCPKPQMVIPTLTDNQSKGPSTDAFSALGKSQSTLRPR